MPEILKSNPALAVLSDDSASGIGAIPGLMLFAVAIGVVGTLMAVSSQRRLWQGAATTTLFWLCAGVMVRPWAFFTNRSPAFRLDPYWAPCWKIAAIVWGVSLLFCIALIISIYQRNKSRERRRRRRRRYGARRQQEEFVEEDDGYDV